MSALAVALHVAAALSGVACGEQARAALLEWHGRIDEAEREPTFDAGTVAFRMPTDEPGRWVRVAIAGGRVAEAARLRRAGVERITWSGV
jgi:hypothetical protein